MTIDTSTEHALALDAADPLASFRDRFWIPESDGKQQLYLVGNSLGLQPKNVASIVTEELEKWQRLGVRGHFESDRPWLPFHEFLTPMMARIVGAQDTEVVVMNTLTVNLHLMMTTFYRPTKTRHKILIESHAFPSDYQAVESQIKLHGFEPRDSIVTAKHGAETELLSEDAICDLIEQNRDSLALVLLPGVQYYTGQLLDMKRITAVAHRYNVSVGFDLAHAVGNVPLALHGWDVDFAVWCNYKYLNSGPGAVGGCFVHERHATDKSMPRMAGWWGHDKSTRFQMENRFDPIPTAEGWQLSNPPILSLAAILASLQVFDDAGGISPLREKSIRLTGYFEALLNEELGDRVNIITPRTPHQRGCQLSIEIATGDVPGKRIHQQLEAAGTDTDWREPNVIRAAPVPLYNSFEDVHRFVATLKGIVS
ncbi:kynureninase [Mariniblastus fucicola]|uniref:Kynureninase n=1 Tax=Mariniblastus fucicola TaxID=980251 RepID=A0A5B9PF29_9BACT|nr:kynureninase [Mariniblastus fucicola]QEG25008.1 Kynureninase [Mariniblastus fucicola]